MSADLSTDVLLAAARGGDGDASQALAGPHLRTGSQLFELARG